ncbi:hypothetical protein [Granulosicoccus antarcticus]|uniref:Lipoprotein n=1 Tax=Granulosicoccus antarcticus IMCC3135 TaxID=1192854 RepID=A0A2Z2NNG9_9GAMM|nr:hypothetical protein [Granulosicoccus antarcticus]ASJ70380.1 hypothetical protein IMCC3135_01305 [Granulosicoccus antarcticus IMCC3135]
MTSLTSKFNKFAITLMFSAVLASGCSSSDNSNTESLPDGTSTETEGASGNDTTGTIDDATVGTTDGTVDNTPNTEGVELEVRDKYHDDNISEAFEALNYISGYYESILPKERPYNEESDFYQAPTEELGYVGITQAIRIDIDASGTGSYSDTYERQELANVHVENQVATRTNTGNSIKWSGTDEWSDDSAGLTTNTTFTIESSLLDTGYRQQTAVIESQSRGYGGYDGTMNLSYTLDGAVIDSSSKCEAISGTLNYSHTASSGTTTIAKAAEDQFWKVTNTENGLILDEYLVRTLGADLYCDFGDF